MIRIAQPVSRDEEMSAVSYLVAKQQPSPAILFERVSGFEKSPIGAWLLWNILGQVPQVRAFEDDRAVVYHETSAFEPGR